MTEKQLLYITNLILAITFFAIATVIMLIISWKLYVGIVLLVVSLNVADRANKMKGEQDEF